MIHITQAFVEIHYQPKYKNSFGARVNLRYGEGEGENILVVNSVDLKPNFRVVSADEKFQNAVFKSGDEYKTIRWNKTGTLIIQGYLKANTRRDLVNAIRDLKNQIYNNATEYSINFNSLLITGFPKSFHVSFVWKFKEVFADIVISYLCKNIK